VASRPAASWPVRSHTNRSKQERAWVETTTPTNQLR
jgi:hypothetical protein